MGGIPSRWRTLTGDSLTDPAWAGVYRSFDVISPWSVNRYRDQTGHDRYVSQFLEPDLAEAKKAGVDYLPVLFPGYSAYNLSWGGEPFNNVRRQGGQFFWHQVNNTLQAGATMLYGAMFDEVDEGTAFYKLIPDKAGIPREGRFVTLDEDGYVLPSDWYLRLAGMAFCRVFWPGLLGL